MNIGMKYHIEQMNFLSLLIMDNDINFDSVYNLSIIKRKIRKLKIMKKDFIFLVSIDPLFSRTIFYF